MITIDSAFKEKVNMFSNEFMIQSFLDFKLFFIIFVQLHLCNEK